MIAFIDDYCAVYEVEPICKVLPIAPSTYYAHAACRADLKRASTRARSDAALSREIQRVRAENFQVYGVRKIWRQLKREGIDVARCMVARLMRQMGLNGVICGKPVRTTISEYAYAQSFPERAARVPGPSILEPYLSHLEARLAQGCENALVLWRVLKELGFAGSAKQVRRWLNERRTAPAKTTPHKWRSDQSGTASDPVHAPAAALLSPRQLAWLLVRSPEALDASATATLARIAPDPEVGGVLARPTLRRAGARLRYPPRQSSGQPARRFRNLA
jgi:hypothetical protein